jgi:hypothetical protein
LGYYKSALFESQVASQANECGCGYFIRQSGKSVSKSDSITNLVTEEDKTERLEDKLVKTKRKIQIGDEDVT